MSQPRPFGVTLIAVINALGWATTIGVLARTRSSGADTGGGPGPGPGPDLRARGRGE